MRSLSAVASVAALVAVFGACSPPEEPKAREKTAATCGGFALSADCKSCTATSCCDAATACRADPVCQASYDCLSACPSGDQACRATCTKGSSAALSKMTACLSTSCASKCGASCGDVGLLLPSLMTRSAACAACVTSKACTTATTCASDAACVSAATCKLGCNSLDAACIEKCVGAGATASDLSKTVKTACGGECDVGKQVACNGNVAFPKVGPAVSTVHVVLPISGAGSPTPIVGAQVKACGKVDIDCLSPVAPAATTDAQGHATFDLPVTELLSGFNGLFLITAPGYVPTQAFYNPPLAGDQTLPTSPVLRDIEFAGATSALGVTPDPERGHIILVIQDCELNAIPGATIEVSSADAKSTLGYFQGGFPTQSAMATDGAGLAGAFNLPPGSVSATAILGGKPVGRGQALIKKGTITLLSVVPSP